MVHAGIYKMIKLIIFLGGKEGYHMIIIMTREDGGV